VLAVTSVVALVGVGTSSASAATYAHSAGSPGHLWVSPVVGRGHVTSSGGVAPGLRLDSTTIGRSAATSGQQTVYYKHHIYEWVFNSGWQERQGTTWQTSVIPAGRGSTYTMTSYQQLLNQHGGSGYWQVATSFFWMDNTTGRHLGTRIVHWNQNGDYACEATRLICEPGPGWVRVA
jgi:hypothetical protein